MEEKNKDEEQEKPKKNSLFEKSKFFQKVKGVKHIEIIIALILVAIILVIYFSTFSSGERTTKNTATVSSVSEYTNFLENKLENVLSSINGAGNVSVMVTLTSGSEYVYATSDEEKTNSNTSQGSTVSTTTVTKQPVIVSNDMVVIKEIMPTVGGVLVVASGAGDTKVKLEILKAVQAVLNVPIQNIEILIGK